MANFEKLICFVLWVKKITRIDKIVLYEMFKQFLDIKIKIHNDMVGD